MLTKIFLPYLITSNLQYRAVTLIAAMSTYVGQVPSDVKLDPRIVPFYENFYRVSDSPEAHDEYVDAMTSDGLLIMGTKKATGKDELMALRKGLWSGPVKTR